MRVSSITDDAFSITSVFPSIRAEPPSRTTRVTPA